MRLIICDLEATCQEGERLNPMETIEIGAVELIGDKVEGYVTVQQFSSFIKPIKHPNLTDFCKNLTSITQEQVNSANTFPLVFSQFMEWINISPESYIFCSWGNYDLNQLKSDCRLHNIPFPAKLLNHINLKESFANYYNCKPMGVQKALRKLNLPFEGTPHRGIDDARNIAKLASIIV